MKLERTTALKFKPIRIKFFCVTVVLVIIGINLFYLIQIVTITLNNSNSHIVTADGFIKGADFIALWPALKLAVGGLAERAYDSTAIQTIQQQLTGLNLSGDRRFLHPPTYLVLLFPLGAIDYINALFIWVLLPTGCFLLVMSRMGLPWMLFILLPLSSAVVQNIAGGQNGTLSAFFLAGALLNLERRPTIAGIMFGFMTFKPPLALLIAPTLVLGRQWHALFTMIITVMVAVAISVCVFGVEPWGAFFHNLLFAQEQLGHGHLPWQRIPSAFVAARMIGLDTPISLLVQAAIAIAAFAGIAWTWWRPIRFRLKAALLVAGIPLATPWIHDYDLVILLVAMAWLVLDADREQMRSFEIVILFFAWMFPAVWVNKVMPLEGIPYGFVILLSLYAIIMFRIVRPCQPALNGPGSKITAYTDQR